MRLGRNALPVLLYHHVGPKRSQTHQELTVEPDRFRRHLDWLRRHRWRSASLEEAVAWAVESRRLPPKSVLITFDDGYADLAEHAFPALLAAGFSATVFIVTGLLGKSSSWDAPLDGYRVLDAEAIKSWSARGIEFAAHTRTHPDLTRLAPAQVADEAVGSRDDLERLIDRPVRAFSYPFGELDEQTRRVVAAAFSVAFTAFEGPNPEGADPYLLARTMVQRFDTPLDVALRVRFGYSAKERARGVIARGRRRLLDRGRQLASTRS